jgi:hypothetical protein
MLMQGAWGDEALQVLDGYEQMVNTLAESAKLYWRWWGPLGEPMSRGVDAWADMQRAYIQFLRGFSGVRGLSSPYQKGNGVVKSRTREIRRSARQSARAAQKTAREAERHAREVVAKEPGRSSTREE